MLLTPNHLSISLLVLFFFFFESCVHTSSMCNSFNSSDAIERVEKHAIIFKVYNLFIFPSEIQMTKNLGFQKGYFFSS